MTIALTYTGFQDKHDNYLNWLLKNTHGNHENIEVVKISAEDNNLEVLSGCDGLILSGGLDFHPKHYGGETGYPNQPDCFNEARDAFEITAFKTAQELWMPVLGVCRGLQIMNCVLGGTLIQDFGETGNAIHKFHHYDKAHGLNIEPNTLLFDTVKSPRGVVNSAHHQSIKTLGNGLQSNCHSDDGRIEGIEWKDKKSKPYLLGVQWHPERFYILNVAHSPLSLGIRNSFIEAATLFNQMNYANY